MDRVERAAKDPDRRSAARSGQPNQPVVRRARRIGHGRPSRRVPIRARCRRCGPCRRRRRPGGAARRRRRAGSGRAGSARPIPRRRSWSGPRAVRSSCRGRRRCRPRRSTRNESSTDSMRWTTTPSASAARTSSSAVGQDRGRSGCGARPGPRRRTAEMATTSNALGPAGGSEGGPRLPGSLRASILLKATSIGLSSSAGSCASELVADDVVAPLGIAVRAVDDVDQDPRPLDVAQERVAEAGARAGAFDQAGDVGDRRPAVVLVAEVQHAEVRLQGGERVVGDLGDEPRSGRRAAWTCPRWAVPRARRRR